MTPGDRTLCVVSLNPDNCVVEEGKQTVAQSLQRNKIHISAIRETHVQYGKNYKMGGYRIIKTAAQRTENQKSLGCILEG